MSDGPRYPVDTGGRPIGPLRLHRALGMNILAGSLITASFGILSAGAAIMTVFLSEHLGASPGMIGLNVALFTLGPLLSTLGAPLFNRVRRRRPLWVWLTAAGRAPYLLLPLVPLLMHHESLRPYLLAAVIAIGALAMAINGMTSVGWWSWMADLIPDRMRGRFFGRRNRDLLIVAALVPLAAGLLLDLSPGRAAPVFAGLFLLCGLLAVADPLLFLWVPEPARGPAEQPTSFRRYLIPLRDRGFRTFLIGACTRVFAGSLPAPFLVLYLRGETVDGQLIGCGASFVVITVSAAVGTAAGVLCSGWWGLAADKIGHRFVFVFGAVSYVVQLLYVFLTPANHIYLLPLLNVLANVVSVSAGVALSNLMIGLSPREDREYYVATYTVLIAMAGALAPWIGGLIGEALPVLPFHMPHGQPATYFHLLLVLSFLLMLLSLLPTMRIPDARGDDAGVSLMRLARGGLIRTIHQLGVIAQTDDPLRRARALATVGPEAAAIAFEDVNAALEDPAPQVRRAALLALGRIGSERAIELLTWHLHEPDAQTREAAAEALGHLPGGAGAPVLVSALRHADSDVRRAAARALGQMGDPRARRPLRRRLQEDASADVRVAAARGLCHMKDYPAVEALIQGALDDPHPVSRSQMTIALGGLFGQAGAFYRLWRRDRRVPGASLAKLNRRLRRCVRRRFASAVRAGRLQRTDAHSARAGLDQRVARLGSLAESLDWTGFLDELGPLFEEARTALGLQGPAAEACTLCVTRLRERRARPEAGRLAWDGLCLAAVYACVAVIGSRTLGADTPC